MLGVLKIIKNETIIEKKWEKNHSQTNKYNQTYLILQMLEKPKRKKYLFLKIFPLKFVANNKILLFNFQIAQFKENSLIEIPEGHISNRL